MPLLAGAVDDPAVAERTLEGGDRTDELGYLDARLGFGVPAFEDREHDLLAAFLDVDVVEAVALVDAGVIEERHLVAPRPVTVELPGVDVDQAFFGFSQRRPRFAAVVV